MQNSAKNVDAFMRKLEPTSAENMMETPNTGTMRPFGKYGMDAQSESNAQSMTKYSKNQDGASEFTRPNFVGRDLSNVRARKDGKKIQYSTDFTKGGANRMRLTHVVQNDGYDTEHMVSPHTIDKEMFKFGGS